MPLIRHDEAKRIGRTVMLYEQLGSTNDECDRQYESVGECVIVADHQTAGRGQYGRTWQARPGTSLLLSVSLVPPAELNRPVILTAWAAVAVAEAILQLTGQQAKIKWPNDLLIRGKKVCGILIEQRSSTIIGLGLNLNQTAEDFKQAALPEAASLAMLSGGLMERDAVLECVLRKLDEEYQWLLEGERTRLEADWKWRIGLLGRQVVAECADGRHVAGRLRDLGFDGLELETGEDSGFRVLQPELIRQLRAG